VKRSIPINIPNSLTLVRVLLTPLFAICLIKHLLGAAVLVFAIAAVTDGLDGLVARIFRQKTRLGAFLDPAADKLLLATAFVTLAIQGMMPSWVTVIVMTRDEARPSVLSKITTVVQLATVISVLVGFHEPKVGQLDLPLFWSTAAMTTVSGLQYIYRGLNILQEDSSHSAR
jgi:cardiolipin synthase